MQRPLSDLEKNQLARLLAELSVRRREALRLYEPLPEQDAFHRCMKRERIYRGSNRAGKTLVGCVELSRACTAQDPFEKYPKRDGRALVVGKDLKQVAQVIFRKLTRAGAYRMIRDPQTQEWRTFRPWQDNLKLSKPAPPLIPARYIDSIAWHNKKENQPSLMKLTTGWEIVFASSEGKPLQGVDLDLVYFDEEVVESTGWYDECAARLLDRQGRFFWTATPQLGTEQLYRLHERFMNGDPDIEEFVGLVKDNPYILADEVAKLEAKLSEEAADVRVHGNYAIDAYRVYPEFSDKIHVTDKFTPKSDWTRYMIVDPGTQVCGVLFVAVPNPEDEEDAVYVYDELYIKRCSAAIFGQEVGKKATGYEFEAFLIDARSGRATEIGSGRTIQEQYAEALKDNKIKSNRTGYDFYWATTDVPGSIESLRQWLMLRPPEEGGGEAKPYLRIHKRCKNLIDELKHYRYRVTDGQPTDKPFDRRDHLVFCARAIAAYKPKWVKPRGKVLPPTGAYAAYLKLNKMGKKPSSPFVHLGPPKRS